MEETIFKPPNIENNTFDDDWDKIVNYDQISYNEGKLYINKFIIFFY
jgi:hypothetical protein